MGVPVSPAACIISITMTDGLHSVNQNIHGYLQTIANFQYSCDNFQRMVTNICKLFSSCLLALLKWQPMQMKLLYASS